MQHSYTALLDEKAPVARAVREMVTHQGAERAISSISKAADNPEVLLRMFGRTEHGRHPRHDGRRSTLSCALSRKARRSPMPSQGNRQADGVRPLDKEGVANFSPI
jgi:hypothetical protein